MPDAGPSTPDSIRRDAERSLFRAKNGIRYLTGMGRPKVGITPSDVVWTREKAKLIRYRSDKRTRHPPLVIVYSIVSRAYILDLRPGASFVSHLLDAGVDVFLLDWGEADAVDATNTLGTYVNNYLPRAVRAACAAAETDEVDVLGYCFGGTMSVLALAGNPELPVRNLALMATPIDFSQIEGVVQAIRRGRVDVDDLLDHTGNVPADGVYRAFASLRPTSDIFKYADIWERLWSDDFVDGYQSMNQWLREQVPFPGGAARQAVELLLRQNAFMTGEVRIDGHTARLKDITCPLLNIMSERDHMVPTAASEPIIDLVGSQDVGELRIPAGHVGLIVGRPAAKTTVPGIVEWLEARSA